jgi:hypothetical protein
MKLYKEDESSPAIPRLMLSPKEAAVALSISEKGLWNVTFPRGSLPAIKAGARTLYPVHLLRRWANQRWLEQQKAAQQQPDATAPELLAFVRDYQKARDSGDYTALDEEADRLTARAKGQQ